jgi:predicted DNA-binding mobile mystery protein A
MSPTQFAKRLGISRQAFQKLEASEAKQTIELGTLRRIADAIDCRVVYAVLPNSSHGTLESLLQEKALKIATEFVGKVSRTMGLEDQAIAKKERDQQIREFADELIGNLDKRLWDQD